VITVVVADGHAIVRSGVRLLLDAEEDLEVVAEAEDVPTALRHVQAHKPSVLIMDPGDATEVAAASPDTGVVVLTLQNDPGFAREALRAGALGYVLKEAADTQLVEAVRMAAEGRTYLHPELGARMATAPAKQEGFPDDLSEREVGVLRLIALGHTNNEIAEQLFLSVRTVESHRARIQQKLRASTRAELVRYALDHGLMSAG
jgi:two-component system, NarL family, response regulator NreC